MHTRLVETIDKEDYPMGSFIANVLAGETLRADDWFGMAIMCIGFAGFIVIFAIIRRHERSCPKCQERIARERVHGRVA